MPTNFPGSLDTTTELPTNQSTASVTGSVHATDHDNANGAIVAIETKLGSGASVPITTGNVLTVTGSGASAWSSGRPFHSTVTSAYTVLPADMSGMIPANATSGSFSITLMAASSVPSGSEVTIKQISVNANTVSLLPSGSDTIDSTTGTQPLVPMQSLTVVSNGSNAWFIK